MQTHTDDAALQALSNQGAMCGTCANEPGNRTCPYCEEARHRYLKALRAIGWAPLTHVQAELDAIKGDLARLTGRPPTP
ncbi:hypothetical protein P1P75_40325 [Streptomyces sp. ID05-39B]|uniref:hypothetical protein n=1 Tax=Streptomyces sp. ID05-39B TaxID=3028664 RepID=UPI0029BE5CE2|nr:hypothetical protein [Streptomyces sp. ID05-39B]MDX3532478.1 hypothetical protein [Streptomyces sp. ID05-39B]